MANEEKDKDVIEKKEIKKTLAPMGKIDQIRNAHRTMQINIKKQGRKTMNHKDRYKWKKELMRKRKYKSDNDLW